ncbi:MAG: ankyrin repeat domain-containing protein [Candidatus Zapsychrus exili]|nr:ankyrin repeat domain-containing protein [Candidatus Zapsychrus exili]
MTKNQKLKIKIQKFLKMSSVFSLLSLVLFASFAFANFKKGGFYSAARNGNIKAVKKMLKLEENKPQNRLNDALQAAVSGNRNKLVRLLIKRGADPNLISTGPSPLLINAIMYDYLKAAKALILSGANIDVRGYRRAIYGFNINWDWTPLMCAAYKGDLSLVKLLMRKKSDINAKGWSSSENDLETAADIAAYSGNLEVLKFLLKKKAIISPTAIFKTVRSGHINTINLLLDKENDINRHGPLEGKTLLIEASWWGRKKIISLLIKKGADVNKPDYNGYTPLSEAVSNTGENFPNQLEVAKLLIEAGADVNQPDLFRITPLMRASKADIIKLLIDKGAK